MVKYCRVCVRRGEKDGGGGDARYVSESDGISFLLAECEGFPIGCVRPLQDMSPCLIRDGKSVVVWQGDVRLSDFVQESHEAGTWPVTTVYAELGLGVLQAMLDAICYMKQHRSVALHFTRKWSHCERGLTDVVARLGVETCHSDAESSA